jgi:hypothetical protein
LEPDVTFTDYGLAIECAALAVLVARRRTALRPLRPWFVVFFATLGVAAVTGGTVHGFFPSDRSFGSRILWPTTLLAIGGTAVSAWAIGARLVLDDRAARRLIAAAWAVFAVYALIVLSGTQAFALAVAHYAPSALFLLGAFVARRVRSPESGLGWGIAALGLMALAALVQSLGIGLRSLYVSPNALYHLIQGVALILFYLAARRLLDPRQGE